MNINNHLAHNINSLIAKRKSIRAFEPNKPLKQDELNKIIEAARWSFSGGNSQPWRFIAGLNGTEHFNKILETLNEGNRYWCKNASALIINLAIKHNSSGNLNKFNLHDLGAASMAMALQAIEMNVFSHPMAGYDAKKIVDNFGIDLNRFDLGTIMAFGYISDDISMLSEKHQMAEKVRSERLVQTELILNHHE